MARHGISTNAFASTPPPRPFSGGDHPPRAISDGDRPLCAISNGDRPPWPNASILEKVRHHPLSCVHVPPPVVGGDGADKQDPQIGAAH
jgi:hypothetical protein